jgi:hypothetical protein
VTGKTSINLGSIFTSIGSDASYLYLNMYDRDNYGGAQTYNYGTLSASNGSTYHSSSYSILFSRNSAGQYVTSTGLSLSNFTFTSSTQNDRIQNIQLAAYNSSWSLVDSRTVDVLTTTQQPSLNVSGAAAIASVAQSYIGQTWNNYGCWVLATAIDAACGVSLDENSGWITSNIYNNGSMKVVYDAYKGINTNWYSGLQVGDQVEMGWINGGGHIVTVDRIFNGIVYIVDNSGATVNDGTGVDLKVAEKS